MNARRLIDILVSALALVAAAPMLAIAMLAIRLESRGAVIYRQPRAGKDAEVFDVLKLRTMVDGAEHIGAGLAIDAGDPRITRVGALLRRASLDELPNLLNVLRGDMSLIGPRPTLPVQVAQLVAEGSSNKQIGTRLFISERTVDSHVRSILNKLGVNSRAQIAVWVRSANR